MLRVLPYLGTEATRRPSSALLQRCVVSSVVSPVERLVKRFQIWLYEEQTGARARSQRDAGERLQIARASHLH